MLAGTSVVEAYGEDQLLLLRTIAALFRLVRLLVVGTLRSSVLWGGGFVLVLGVVLVVAEERKAHAQQEQVDGALLLIMDASGSMKEKDDNGVPLIDGAKQALNGVVDALPEGTPVGLRVYGHRVPNTDRARGCEDTELIQPIEPLDPAAMKQTIASFEAKGFTPIGYSLQQAANDLPPEGPRTIVLVSDGEDTCAPPPPCEVARDLVAQGIDVKIETVGFFIQSNRQAQDQLRCIAETTGGTYRSADNSEELVEELETISSREARAFVAQGQQATGAPTPMDAETIEPGVSYTDTVLGFETNYYRFEVEEGQTVEAELIREARTDLEDSLCPVLDITDRDDTSVADADIGGELANVAQIKAIDPFEVPEGTEELFLKLETYGCAGEGDFANDEFPIEFSVNVTGAEETTSAKEPDEGNAESGSIPDSGSGEPEEAGGSVANTALVFLSGMLAMLVIGLAVALYVVLRRRGGGGRVR